MRFRIYPYNGFRKREQKRTEAHLEKAFEKLDWKRISMGLRYLSVYPNERSSLIYTKSKLRS